jgi:tRNA-dihydrouridine synthase A
MPTAALQSMPAGARGSHARTWRVAVAPMMDCTDRHCRYFHRLLTPDAGLYTEMITATAIVHGDRDRLLARHPAEGAVALQLGGSDPDLLARAAALAVPYGYGEVNLNVGCPSPRVAEGSFGACLLKEPALVARCVAAMAAVVPVPVTVKTRIGVDDLDDYDHLAGFVEQVSGAGCRMFMQGLSPRENRTVPPLRYDVAYRLKTDFPGLDIVVNGGIADAVAVEEHLGHVDGVMIGRQAYAEPWLLAELQARGLAGRTPRPGWQPPDRHQVVLEMADYLDGVTARGERAQPVIRHLLGLWHGLPGARRWRRFLTEGAVRPGASGQLLRDSLALLATGGGSSTATTEEGLRFHG